MTKQPPGSRCAATLRKHATCAACVVRFMIVLKTRYATRERAVDGRRREVADRHADVLGARLRAESRDHRLRQLDPVHRHPPLRERQRDPAGPDPELERASLPGERGKEVDGRVDHRRVEHLRLGVVVARGDALVEVAVVVHRRNLPARDPTPERENATDIVHGRGAEMDSWATGIGAITLFVEDLDAAKQFYVEVFGLPVFYEDDNSAVFKFGDTLINLLKTGEAHALIEPAKVASPDAGARIQFTIGVDDVDAMCVELAKRGVKLLNGPMDRPWGIRTASFTDPGGHIWEIAH